MSRTFDVAVDAAWGKFEEQLTARVRSEQDGYLEIEPAEGDDVVPFVTVDWDADELEAELIGLSADLDFSAVEALGWLPPEDPEEDPFWGVVLPYDELEVLVGMVSSTLRYVFGVADPAFVAGVMEQAAALPPRPSDGAEDESDEECDHEPVIGFPHSSEELVEMVERTLEVSYGTDLIRDSDGDFPIHTGVVPLWVHVDDEAPVVRLFSYVVRSVKDLRQARIEVGILNRRTPYLRFTLEEGTIVASYELAAGPFVGPLLLNTIDRVTELLNEVAADSATRVSGKLWFADREDAGSTPDRGEAS